MWKMTGIILPRGNPAFERPSPDADGSSHANRREFPALDELVDRGPAKGRDGIDFANGQQLLIAIEGHFSTSREPTDETPPPAAHRRVAGSAEKRGRSP